MTRTLLIVALLTLPLAACSQAAAPTREPLPEGWTRVQVREGFVGRDFANPLAGFEIDLPPGWRAGEGWPGTKGPAGWVAAAPTSDTENVPVLRFNMGDPPSNFPESENSVIVASGVPATLHLAPTEDGLGPNVGIYYEHIPGGPVGVDTPTLDIEGDSRGFDDQVLLTRVLTSIWYAEIDALPALPAVGLTPGADWVRTTAPTSEPSFSLLLPPGWHMEARMGVDSAVGVIEGPGVSLYYEYGRAASAYDPLMSVRDNVYVPHRLWEEISGDVRLRIARAISPEPHPCGTTAGVRSSLTGGPSVGIYGWEGELTGEQQDIVLALLRSVALEAE